MDDPALRARRSRSFGAVAAAYAAHRPGYPDAALDWALRGVPGRRLLDLGAGTGALTASLVGRGDVVAVEPDPAMLAQLRAGLPGVEAHEGRAEAVPLPDASVDAVLVGQAWHWFDLPRAQAEIARVLRPGGVLALVWNGDDATVEWVAGFHGAVDRGRPVPTGTDPPPIPWHPAFGPSQHRRFPNPRPTTTDGLVDTLATHSWALVSEPADRDAAFARLRAYLAARPETSSGAFVLPLVTDVLRAPRR